MRSIETGLKMVQYTISGTAGYARMTPAELETLREIAAKGDELVITSVTTYRRKTVR